MKQRNQRFGCPRIAQQISLAFGIDIIKDGVRLSHPFVERLIGSIGRELLDQMFFWNATDLQKKLTASAPAETDVLCAVKVKADRPLQLLYPKRLRFRYIWQKLAIQKKHNRIFFPSESQKDKNPV
ncbi:MAG: hypothetical protein P8Y45_19210 [Exilibacterium sp.]